MIDSRDLKELSEEEREYLSKQFDLHKKSAVKYAFFCVFLGFVGGHQYYLGKQSLESYSPSLVGHFFLF